MEKFMVKKGGSIQKFHRNFFVSYYRKTSWGNPSVFQKISGMEKIMVKKRGRIQKFHRNFFVSHYQKISWGNPSVFQKISGIEKVYGERGYQKFLSKLCCLKVPKNFIGENFCDPENIWYRKSLWIREGGIKSFCRKFVVSRCRKTSLGKISVFQKISGIKKICGGGGIKNFCRNFVVSRYRKTS